MFEGVSHLVSAILISSAATIKKINTNGVKKMCRNIFAIQHTLTASITGRRELALDQAKTFYELFNLTPKELLSSIVERGAMFRELDYMNALQLMHRYRKCHMLYYIILYIILNAKLVQYKLKICISGVPPTLTPLS